MTIQECYQNFGGDFSKMEKRLPNVNLIKKFITKFLSDGSFSELCHAMEEGQRAEAFQAAHTFKGVCGNLSLDRLYNSSSKLTELLRQENDTIPEGADVLMEEVEQDYAMTVNAIRTYLEEEDPA